MSISDITKNKQVLRLMSDRSELTQEIGRAIGVAASAGDVYLLIGELGAGKTTLTQGILWGLGLDDHARSPTFVLMSEYYARLTLYHMDLYRLDDVQDMLDLGIEDYVYGNGVCVVEWADKAIDIFPDHSMTIHLESVDENTRTLTLTWEDERYSEVVSGASAVAGKVG